MRAYERLLNYVKVWTTSDEESTTSPTTARQFDLAKLLVEEMKEMGIEDAMMDEYGYVYGHIPATPGYENRTAIGFIAHMDTAPDYSGENVKPQIIENYDGKDVVLGTSGRTLTVSDFPALQQMAGRTLITTDGTTLLGADDKAGIAEILTVAEELLKGDIPHGKVCISFTTDEEVGSGACHMDLERFGAPYAYTVGLEKDLLLPFKEQLRKVREGDEVLVTLYIDKSNRLCATMEGIYHLLSTDSPYKKGDTVTGRVYEFSDNFGTFVAVDDKYSARIPGFENTTALKIGDIIEANVTNRKPDGKLDLTIRAKAYVQMNKDAEDVLRIIDEYGGVLPFNDKASPEIIKREAHMSKNAFKRAVGHLYKERLIEFTDKGIRRV